MEKTTSKEADICDKLVESGTAKKAYTAAVAHLTVVPTP